MRESRLRSVILVAFHALVAASATGAAQAWSSPLFLSVPDRVDAVYDGNRGLVYISTTSGRVLRYDLQGRAFLDPIELGGSLVGLDLSPGGARLAVADREIQGDRNRIHVVELDSGTSTAIPFTRDFYEGGTYSVAWTGDDSLLTTSSFQGSGWAPLRSVIASSGSYTTITQLRQNTMLSASADRRVVAYAEANISSGSFGLYDVTLGSLDGAGTGWFAFEVAVSRDGSRIAVPSYFGTFVYDGDFELLDVIGTYASSSPIGVAYSPVSDVLYTAWWGTSDAVRAIDATTLELLEVIDDELVLGWIGNWAFGSGRLRIDATGSVLSLTVPGGVNLYLVPEPTSLALLATGLAGLSGARRRSAAARSAASCTTLALRAGRPAPHHPLHAGP